MDCEDVFDDIVQQSIALDNRVAEYSSRIKTFEKDIKVKEEQNKESNDLLLRLQSVLTSKDNELEVLFAHKRSQEEQIKLLLGLSVQLRNEIKKKETMLLQKTKQYTETLEKYDGIWDAYMEKYKTFPRVAERDSLQIEAKCKEIKLKVKMQELMDKRRQEEELRKIRALQGSKLSSKVQELYAQDQDLDVRLAKVKNEIEERRALLRAKKIQKQEEDQRRLAEEEQEKKMRDEMKSRTSIAGAHNKSYLMGISLDRSITSQDIPMLSIPDFDSLDDMTQVQPQPFSSQSQFDNKNHPTMGNLLSVKTVKQNTRNSLWYGFESLPKELEQNSSTTLSTNTESKALEENFIEGATPAGETTTVNTAEKQPASQMEALPIIQMSNSSCNAEKAMGKEQIQHKFCGTSTPKKEQTIHTDNIVAKLRDMVKQANTDAYTQDSGSFLPSLHKDCISKENKNEAPAHAQDSFANQGTHIQENDGTCTMQSKESETSDANQDPQRTEIPGKVLMNPCSTYDPPNELTQNLGNQPGNDTYDFNADYDLYDDSSMPPSFDAPSTSNSEVGFTSPILSPRMDDLEPPTSAPDNNQPFSSFSFYTPSSTNLFGGPNNNASSQANQDTSFQFRF